MREDSVNVAIEIVWTEPLFDDILSFVSNMVPVEMTETYCWSINWKSCASLLLLSSEPEIGLFTKITKILYFHLFIIPATIFGTEEYEQKNILTWKKN